MQELRLNFPCWKNGKTNSLIILYPDQFGDPQEIVSFSDPRGHNESQHYEKVGKWFYKWLKKS